MSISVEDRRNSAIADLPPLMRGRVGELVRLLRGKDPLTEAQILEIVSADTFSEDERAAIARWTFQIAEQDRLDPRSDVIWRNGLAEPKEYARAIVNAYFRLSKAAFGGFQTGDILEDLGWDVYRLMRLGRILSGGCQGYLGVVNIETLTRQSDWLYKVAARLEYPTVWHEDRDISFDWHWFWACVAASLGRPVRKGVPWAEVLSLSDQFRRVEQEIQAFGFARPAPWWARMLGVKGAFLVPPAPDRAARPEDGQ